MAVADMPIEEAVSRFFASELNSLQDPPALFDRLLREAPIMARGENSVLVSSYALCKQVLFDSKRFSNEFMSDSAGLAPRLEALLEPERREIFRDFVDVERSLTFLSDGKEHERRRKALTNLFAPRRVAQYTAVAQEYVNEIVDQIRDQDEVDLAPYAYQLSGPMIAYLLGVPRSDCKQFAQWVDPIAANLHAIHGLDAAYDAILEIRAYLQHMLKQPADQRTELFNAIVEASEGFGPNRLLGIFLEMNLGGTESVRGLLSGGLAALLTSPQNWNLLKNDASLMPNAIEELVRYVTPGYWTSRTPLEEVEIEGVVMKPGQIITVLVAAGNRDPEVFADPNIVDITRANARNHLSFGFGRHSCLGQFLGRLEGNIFIGTLLQRFPDMELTVPKVRWIGHAQNPAVESLPVRLGRIREAASSEPALVS